MRKVLFLCTGNYYRSRLAEELLRAYSSAEGLDLLCDSAALGPVPNPNNPGPIGRRVLEYLNGRGVASDSVRRFPKPCTASDVATADLIVCMNEREHRPMLTDQFGDSADARVRYWHVPDVHEDPAALGPGMIEANVRALLQMVLTSTNQGIDTDGQ